MPSSYEDTSNYLMLRLSPFGDRDAGGKPAALETRLTEFSAMQFVQALSLALD